MYALLLYLPQKPKLRSKSVDSVETDMCLGRSFVLQLDRCVASVGRKIILALSADL